MYRQDMKEYCLKLLKISHLIIPYEGKVSLPKNNYYFINGCRTSFRCLPNLGNHCLDSQVAEFVLSGFSNLKKLLKLTTHFPIPFL